MHFANHRAEIGFKEIDCLADIAGFDRRRVSYRGPQRLGFGRAMIFSLKFGAALGREPSHRGIRQKSRRTLTAYGELLVNSPRSAD
ncbi:MAG: hypothetical protein WA177_02015 [Xanthobacteraceae bacterium]